MDLFLGPAFNEYYRQFPLVLVDVGASGGVDGRWRRAKKCLQVIAFEPDEREFADLVNSVSSYSIRYFNTGLYRQKAVLDFHLLRRQQVSSILKPNRRFLDRFPESERFDIVRTVQIETDTLDSQLQEQQIQDVDFVKIDTQGSELFILEGATRILADSIFGLEIEVEFVKLYQDQPLFSDVDGFVRKQGFQLFDLRPYYWKRTIGKNYGKPKGQIICADSLYLRDLDSFSRVLDQIKDKNLKKSKVLRAISICILYGYLDYALEIFKETSSLFNKDEARLFFRKVKWEISLSRIIPNFRGRGRIAGLFYKLYKVTETTYHGWGIAGKVLGNLE